MLEIHQIILGLIVMGTQKNGMLFHSIPVLLPLRPTKLHFRAREISSVLVTKLPRHSEIWQISGGLPGKDTAQEFITLPKEVLHSLTSHLYRL